MVTDAVTADELLAMPDDGFLYELIEGELRRMSPAGSEHGAIGMTQKSQGRWRSGSTRGLAQ